MLTFGKAETSAIVASVVDFSLSFILVQAVGTWYAQASFFGALAGGIINCYVNYQWVFDKQKQRKPYLMLKYFVVWSISILLNTSGTWFFTELSGVNFIIIKFTLFNSKTTFTRQIINYCACCCIRSICGTY